MPPITIEYYGRLLSTTGRPSEYIADSRFNYASQVIEYAINKYTDSESFEGVAIAVNGELASPGQPIKDGDTVALLPPVSGG